MIRLSPTTPPDRPGTGRTPRLTGARWLAALAAGKDRAEAARQAAPASTRYRFSTRLGMFCIELRRTGVWCVLFGRKELGAFRSAESALGDLLHDETAWPGGPRNSGLGLPTDLAEWAPSSKKPR